MNEMNASIQVTLDVYTHLEDKDVVDEFNRVVGSASRYSICPLERKPALVSLADDSPEDEGEPDFSESPDDDD